MENIKHVEANQDHASSGAQASDYVCWTPQKYVFDVTSVGQSSWRWPSNSGESRDNISSRVQASFNFLVRNLCGSSWTNLSVSIEAKYWVYWLSRDV